MRMEKEKNVCKIKKKCANESLGSRIQVNNNKDSFLIFFEVLTKKDALC